MNTTTQDKNLELSITLALRFNTTNGIIEKKNYLVEWFYFGYPSKITK